MPLVELDHPEPHVAVLRLNRPEARNALSPELREELRAHVEALGRDPAIRAIVLTGDQRAFAAGADIKSMAAVGPGDMMARGDAENWAALRHCPKPIIAAVEGYALGGGCELAMHADVIVAGQDALFGQPEVRLGIMPGAGGTQRLARAVGKYRAMLMLLAAEPLSAPEALAAGLASKVVATGTALAESVAIGVRIAAMPPLAVQEIKRVLIAGLDAPLDTALMLERRAAYLLFATEDKAEAMSAFLEKRQGRYVGR